MYTSHEANISEMPGPDGDAIPVASRWLGSWRLSLHRRALSTSELIYRYDKSSARWDQTLARLDYPGTYETLMRTLLDIRAMSADAAPLRVLDSGIGTGELSLALARATRYPLRLDAIDISPRMLEQARSRLHRTAANISLRQGDARQLPYRDGVFDIAMTAHLLEHLAKPCAALAEMVRVTKPGGQVMVCLTRRSMLGLYIQLKWRTHLVSPAQAEVWLRESGLQDVRCLSSETTGAFRHLSVACVGTKPT